MRVLIKIPVQTCQANPRYRIDLTAKIPHPNNLARIDIEHKPKLRTNKK